MKKRQNNVHSKLGKGGGKGANFWDKEYKNSDHLALSTNPSEDLQKFCRFLERGYEGEFLNPNESVLDLGCGNGRNLIYLSNNFGMNGFGYDISSEAISQAKKLSVGLPIEYETRSIASEIPLPDESQTIVLDMMTSHFLVKEEREKLLNEIARVLKPGGWFFYKTFLLDEDKHAKRLISDHPAEEPGSYIHPEIGVAEHVFTVEEIKNDLKDNFIIHKLHKSHGHLGSKAKRRSISVYAEKN